jgi:hypothetical protein
MTMRRLTVLFVIAAACGTALSLGILGAVLQNCPRGSHASSSVTRSLHRFAPAPAAAEEVMEFKPVPAESVAEVTRSRTRRNAVPAAPAAPGVPEPPAPPAAPAEPDKGWDSGRSGDVVRFGSDIHVSDGQTISGDVVAMGGDVTVDGHVEGDVVAMGGDVKLGSNGKVDGQVVTIGGQLHEEPGSYVGGQRVSAGGLPRGWGGWPFLGFLGMVGSGLKALWTVAKMIVLLLIAWGFTQLAPHRTLTAFNAFKREPLMCFGIGLLAWALVIPSIVALVLVIAILCITIIGIPVALAVLLGYVLAFALLIIWGYVIGAAALGERLSRQLGRTATNLTMMAVWGIVALTTIKVVGLLFGGLPMGGFAGGLLVFLAAVISGVLVTIGAGSLLRTQARREAIGQWWTSTRGGAGATPAPAAATPASTPTPAPSAPTSTPPGTEPPPAGF